MLFILILLSFVSFIQSKEYYRHTCNYVYQNNTLINTLTTKNISLIKLCSNDFNTMEVVCKNNTPMTLNGYDGCNRLVYTNNIQSSNITMYNEIYGYFIMIPVVIIMFKIFVCIIKTLYINTENRKIILIVISITLSIFHNIQFRYLFSYNLALVIYYTLVISNVIDLVITIIVNYFKQRLTFSNIIIDLYLVLFDIIMIFQIPYIQIPYIHINMQDTYVLIILNNLISIWLIFKIIYKSKKALYSCNLAYISIVNLIIITPSIYRLFMLIIIYIIFQCSDYKNFVTRLIFSIVNNLLILFVLYTSTSNYIQDFIITLVVLLIPIFANLISKKFKFSYNSIYLNNLVNVIICYGQCYFILNIQNTKYGMILVCLTTFYELLFKTILLEYKFESNVALDIVPLFFAIGYLIYFVKCHDSIVFYFWIAHNIIIFLCINLTTQSVIFIINNIIVIILLTLPYFTKTLTIAFLVNLVLSISTIQLVFFNISFYIIVPILINIGVITILNISLFADVMINKKQNLYYLWHFDVMFYIILFLFVVVMFLNIYSLLMDLEENTNHIDPLEVNEYPLEELHFSPQNDNPPTYKKIFPDLSILKDKSKTSLKDKSKTSLKDKSKTSLKDFEDPTIYQNVVELI